MYRIVGLIIGYLFGCVQIAYIMGKINKNIDIREYGSGNSGTTNAIRVMGWKIGALTFLGDILKAVIAVVIVQLIFDNPLAGFYTGVGVILGHDWPIYLKFRGGKGIASTIGLMLILDYRIGIIMAVIILITLIITRYVSLGAILIVISIPVQLVIFGYMKKTNGIEYILMGIILMLFALIRHKDNIKRLLAGTESKLGHKKDAIT